MSVKSAAAAEADFGLGDLYELLEQARRQSAEADSRVYAAERALEAARQDQRFVDAKVAQFAKTLNGGAAVAALAAQPYDERLLKLLKGKQGGWTKPQREGATDAEILKLLTVGFKAPNQWGDYQDAGIRGGPKPKAWIREFGGSTADKPLLEGAALAKEARRLLEIPEPKAPAAKPATKKRSRSRPRPKPAAKKPAAKKGGGPSGTGGAPTAAAVADRDEDEELDEGDAQDVDLAPGTGDGGGYDSGHPWYYKLGGRLLSAEEITPSAVDADDLSAVRRTFKLSATDPAKLAKLTEAALAKARKDVADQVAEYERLVELVRQGHGREFLSGPERTDQEAYEAGERDGSSSPLHTAISLVHNHVHYAKLEVAALEQIRREAGGSGTSTVSTSAPAAASPVPTKPGHAVRDAEETVNVAVTGPKPRNEMSVTVMPSGTRWVGSWECTIRGGKSQSGVSGRLWGEPQDSRPAAVREAAERMLDWLSASFHKSELRASLDQALADLLTFIDHNPACRPSPATAGDGNPAKPSPARAATIAGLPAHLRPLMDDPRVDDHGIYPNPTRHRLAEVPADVAEAVILTMRGNDDHWRAGHSVRWKRATLDKSPEPVMVRAERYPIEAMATLSELDRLIRFNEERTQGAGIVYTDADRAEIGKLLAGLRAARKRLFAAMGDPPAEGAVTRRWDELAADGFRPQTFGQWMATFRGCMPAEIAFDPADARIRKYYDDEARPSDAAREYREHLAAAAAHHTALKADKPVPAPAAALAIPTPKEARQKQTFGQWLASFNASLSAKGIRAVAKGDAERDAAIVAGYGKGSSASNAAANYAARPKPSAAAPTIEFGNFPPAAAARKPNGASHPKDPAALAVGYASHAGAAIPALGGMVH